MRRLLLLSAYHVQSHAYWCEGLQQALPEYHWTLLTLPPRHFQWRVRGNPLSWLHHPALQHPYDGIIATSMVDLATLKGTRPHLAQAPALVYFHENQFDYPKNIPQHDSIEPQMVSIYSALAATRVVFNSTYNRDTFIRGVEALMDKLPDHIPQGLATTLQQKTSVIPVPLDDTLFQHPPSKTPGQPLTLVWNHRWEYDKGPDRLLLFLNALERTNTEYRIHIVGQQFRQQPEAFNHIKQQFNHRIGTWGYVENKHEYHALLAKSHVVLSTALHDFQGLAMQEAMALGCVPLAPNRLAYPEYVPENCLYESRLDDVEGEAVAAVTTLQALPRQSIDMSASGWGALSDAYQHEIEALF